MIKITNPEKTATPVSIFDRVKTVEDAFNVLGITGDVATIELHKRLEKHEPALAAQLKLFVVVEALNEGWKPDWNNTDQRKYYPWFDLENEFSLGGVFYFFRYSRVSSRLCFRDEKTARYAAGQFLDLYKTYFTI